MTRPRRNAAPRMLPMTIPAICPPDNPGLLITPAAAPIAPLVGEVVPGEVAEELAKRGCIEVKVGRRTLAHLVPALDVMQQESVALRELELQYVHKPSRLVWKPQLVPSLAKPGTHVSVIEPAGSAQLVKSARS